MAQVTEPRATAQPNIQDVFLNYARRERLQVMIHLLDGRSFDVRIKNFDRFAVIVELEGADHLIFKHAISTVAVGRIPGFSEKPRMVPTATTTAPAESTDVTPASGTEG